MKSNKNRRKGSILIFILALIVLLSVLCLRLMEEGIREARHLDQFHRKDDLRIHAYSALDIAVGVLAEFKMFEGKLYSPAQGWGEPLAYAGISPTEDGVTWSVRLIDESAKVPISKVKEKDLVALFALMQAEEDSLVDEDDGQPFYDSMMDWVDADEEEREEGAEDDYYEDLDHPYFTPGKKINSFEEFRMIKGFAHDPEDPDRSGIFFDAQGIETVNMKNFRESFSFFNQGPVNVNNASPFLMRFLCGDDDRLYEEFMDGPSTGNGEGFYTNPNDPGMMPLRANSSLAMSTSVTMFRVEVTVTRGLANFQLHAVLSSGGALAPQNGTVRRPPSRNGPNLGYPFKVLSIRENENMVD